MTQLTALMAWFNPFRWLLVIGLALSVVTACKSRQRGHGDYRLLLWIIAAMPYIAVVLACLAVWGLWRWFK